METIIPSFYAIALNSSLSSQIILCSSFMMVYPLTEWETVYATEAIKFHPLAILFYCRKVITPLQIVVSMEIEL